MGAAAANHLESGSLVGAVPKRSLAGLLLSALDSIPDLCSPNCVRLVSRSAADSGGALWAVRVWL